MAQTRSTTSSSGTTRAPQRGHGNPGMLLVLGLFLISFAFLIITLQTQTSEAYINGTQQKDETFLQAQWTIWLQIPKLAFGRSIPGPDVGPNDLPGIVIGQGVELVYLSLIAGLEIAMHTSKKLGRVLGAIVIVFLLLIAVFDFWTDLAYGNVSSETHIVFALFCTLVIGFFPTWGLTLIEHGWKRL